MGGAICDARETCYARGSWNVRHRAAMDVRAAFEGPDLSRRHPISRVGIIHFQPCPAGSRSSSNSSAIWSISSAPRRRTSPAAGSPSPVTSSACFRNAAA